ncbi:hypothetical protein [Microbacterium sp. VKM Ac-2923]|uniref:hypothetical protein n=1 Tax=Microbacterium sp. VKM Ac-2923 TaxID=2929476 RepID=UPI001FB4276C|nr:hypothetical protein [Microbacterium sp. VKM Ac-2923]
MAFVFAAVSLFGATSASASSTGEAPGEVVIGSLESLTADESALLESDKLKRVTVDPSSGDVTSVEPLTRAQLNGEVDVALRSSGQAKAGSGVSPLSATWNMCSSAGSATCWYGAAPTLNLQFSYGATNGTWGSRTKLWTGNYYVKACWVDPQPSGIAKTVCMPLRNGKNAWIEWGSVLTGKSMDVSNTR